MFKFFYLYKTYDISDKQLPSLSSTYSDLSLEIEEHDWMGLNYFLYVDPDNEEGAAKAEMTCDENNNIDSDISDYVMSNTESQNPVVLEEIDRMNANPPINKANPTV